MTGAQLTALIRRKTKSTSTTYPDADLLIDINTYKDELAGKLQRHRPSIWHMPALFDLDADTREYAQPQDILNSIVSLELKLGDDYVLATGLKEAPRIPLTEDEITAMYTDTEPFYFLRRKAIYILTGDTVPDVTDGGKLTYNAFPQNLANLTGITDLSIDPTTTTHGFPREFHELWARRVAIAYKDINGLPLNREDQLFEVDLEKALEDFSDEDQSLENFASMPARHTFDDSGFNL